MKKLSLLLFLILACAQSPALGQERRSPGLRGALAGESGGNGRLGLSGANRDALIITDKERKRNYLSWPIAMNRKEAAALKVAQLFFAALKRKDFPALEEQLSEGARFSDPAYPSLSGKNTRAMWHMITSSDTIKVSYKIRKVESNRVYATWVARYELNGRPIVNRITSKLTIIGDKVAFHRDEYDFDHWADQALPAMLVKALGLLGSSHKHQALRMVSSLALRKFKFQNGY